MTNEVTKTAPEEIYLQVSPNAYDCEDPFPVCHEEITWCFDSVLDCEVKYVRADLCRAAINDVERYQWIIENCVVYDAKGRRLIMRNKDSGEITIDAARGE